MLRGCVACWRAVPVIPAKPRPLRRRTRCPIRCVCRESAGTGKIRWESVRRNPSARCAAGRTARTRVFAGRNPPGTGKIRPGICPAKPSARCDAGRAARIRHVCRGNPPGTDQIRPGICPRRNPPPRCAAGRAARPDGLCRGNRQRKQDQRQTVVVGEGIQPVEQIAERDADDIGQTRGVLGFRRSLLGRSALSFGSRGSCLGLISSLRLVSSLVARCRLLPLSLRFIHLLYGLLGVLRCNGLCQGTGSTRRPHGKDQQRRHCCGNDPL